MYGGRCPITATTNDRITQRPAHYTMMLLRLLLVTAGLLVMLAAMTSRLIADTLR